MNANKRVFDAHLGAKSGFLSQQMHAMHAWFRYDGFMAMITIRNLDGKVKQKLRGPRRDDRATDGGRSARDSYGECELRAYCRNA